ncbi:ribbon-helix-helix protein, CopG family [Haloechinothrix sp. YIM 98757]|uniref:Ribbon-helix-helix protein, CopG family n=1 Tax=Haloechinothrix aidingensis TaxID=2752311 RepID=A0A838AEW6_9PSEU|nr:ribbon-helix-helix protein, CopG family [Haloechinothrix aidingensis]MBA0127668.1 ribbon-helix-helix protein, CopG family [Haloechinothrix aidingensis]
MKTAISIPDATFDRVEKRAAAMHLSRSEFYARAAQRYLEELESSELAQHIDEAVSLAEEDDSNTNAATAGRTRLTEASGDW